MKKPALYTAAVIFAAVGLVHLVRFFLDIEVVVGEVIVPLFPSLPIGLGLILLALWMMFAARDG